MATNHGLSCVRWFWYQLGTERVFTIVKRLQGRRPSIPPTRSAFAAVFSAAINSKSDLPAVAILVSSKDEVGCDDRPPLSMKCGISIRVRFKPGGKI